MEACHLHQEGTFLVQEHDDRDGMQLPDWLER